MRNGSLMLVWCEYYVRKPSRIFRTPYSAAGFRDDAPCRITAKISKDGGRSWSGKITLQENFGTDNVKHPNLLRLPTGEILFSFTVRDMAKRDLRIYLKRSTDECETWTTPLQISPPGGVYYTNADHNLLHSSGRVILPLHYWNSVREEKPHYQAFCLYSDDEGKNWQASRKGADLPLGRRRRARRRRTQRWFVTRDAAHVARKDLPFRFNRPRGDVVRCRANRTAVAQRRKLHQAHPARPAICCSSGTMPDPTPKHGQGQRNEAVRATPCAARSRVMKATVGKT